MNAAAAAAVVTVPPTHHLFLSTGGIVTLCVALITGLMVPVVIFQLGRQDRRAEVREARADKFRTRMEERIAAQDAALATNTQGLAVLIRRADDAGTTLAKIPGLEASTEVLRARIEQHEAEADRTRAELRRADEANAEAIREVGKGA